MSPITSSVNQGRGDACHRPCHRPRLSSPSFALVLCLLLCICLPIVSIACTSPQSEKTYINFPDAMPPATSLVCPGEPGEGQPRDFVGKSGVGFADRGVPLKLYGYTFYPASLGGSLAWHSASFTQYIDHILAMGVQTGQTVVRPTDFWGENDHPQQWHNAVLWKNIDYLVCAARLHNMYVIMDVSAFQKYVIHYKYDAFNADNWVMFLRALGNHYKDESTIAMYSILGEPEPPKNLDALNRLVDFYRVTTDELHQADEGRHLVNAGGFNHMEDETPALPWWHTIYSLPHNDVIGFKTYSLADLQLMPTIAAVAEKTNKPLLDEEFGLPQRMGDAQFAGGRDYNNITTSRAQFYHDVYSAGEQVGVTAFIFWDMGCALNSGSYQVGIQTPAVWLVVQQHAPRQPGAATSSVPLCPF